MRRLIFMLTLALTLGYAVSANGQTQFFDNPKVEFTLELPSATWRSASVPDDVNQGLEFVNGIDRADGLLRIRKEVVDAGVTAEALARRDQDQRLRYQPGYVDGKQENFSGNLSGVVLSYEYTNGGKPMAGRIYYLKGDNRTIYTLRFTGKRDSLSRMRNQTDLVARSFKLR
jgi:hypothetical protein